MADRKITDLTALAAGSQATGDLLTIVDVSEVAAADKNKKITVESLFKGIPGDVGIGTSSPANTLHVDKDTGSTPTVYINNSGSDAGDGVALKVQASQRGAGVADASVFSVHNNASEIFTVRNDGNVGIGTSTITEKLEVAGDIRIQNAVKFRADDGAENGAIKLLDDDEFAIESFGSSGVVTVSTGSSNSERLRIDSSGRLLINNSSVTQSHPLQVTAASDAHAIAINGRSSDDIGELTFFENDRSTRLGEIQYRQDHVNFRHRVGDIRFATAGSTERMRIDSSGNVGIGTTSPAALCHINKTSGTTLYRASVAGNSTIGLEIVKTGATTQSWRIVDGQTANGKLEFYDVTDSATRMCIDGSGNVGIGTTSPTQKLSLENGTFKISGTSSFASNVEIGRVGGDNNLAFATGGTERMRITPSGGFLVATTNQTPGLGDSDTLSLIHI